MDWILAALRVGSATANDDPARRYGIAAQSLATVRRKRGWSPDFGLSDSLAGIANQPFAPRCMSPIPAPITGANEPQSSTLSHGMWEDAYADRLIFLFIRHPDWRFTRGISTRD